MASWWTQPHAGLRIGGHRGSPGLAPENTMASFRAAIDAGVDYLELDVHRSLDGLLVVIHDEELDRTTNGSGPVSAATSEVLAGLDAGSWYASRFTGERLPLLSDVLDMLVHARTASGGRIGAVVEAKGNATGGPLAAALDSSPVRDRLAICSFSMAELLAARRAVPDLPTMLIVDRDQPDPDFVALARASAASVVNIPAARLAAADVDRLHNAGLLVSGGTGDEEAAIRHARAIGLDAIDSNVPEQAVAWRAAAGGRPVGSLTSTQ